MRHLAEPVLDVDPPVLLRGKVADDVRGVAGEPGGAAQVLRQRGAARLREVKRPLVGQHRGRRIEGGASMRAYALSGMLNRYGGSEPGPDDKRFGNVNRSQGTPSAS